MRQYKNLVSVTSTYSFAPTQRTFFTATMGGEGYILSPRHLICPAPQKINFPPQTFCFEVFQSDPIEYSHLRIFLQIYIKIFPRIENIWDAATQHLFIIQLQ